jgi:hypothetical protein
MRWSDYNRRETRGHAIAAAAIFAVTILFFLPLLPGRTYSMVGAHMFAQYPWIGVTKESTEIGGRGFPQTDHAEVFYPTSVFATNALQSGQFPMWLPYSFGGVPIMEVGIGAGLLYPPKLLAMTVLSPIRQHDLMLFSHLLLAGLGMYALLRCWGANLLGAVFGAVVWELNGHNAFWLTLEHVAIAAAWFPLTLLCATLAVRKQSWRWAIATGVALGMSILNGIHHYGHLSAFVLAAWYLVLTIPVARKLFAEGQRRSALWCGFLPMISAVVSLAVSAASWLSLLGLLSHVHRQSFTMEQQLAGAIPFRSFVRGLVFPLSSFGPAGKAPDFASFAFVGIPALIFVLAALLRPSLPGIFATIIGAFSLGVALGVPFLIAFFRLVLPYFGTTEPHVAFYFFCFAVAVMAGLGITEIGRHFKGDGARAFLLGLWLPLIAVESLQLIGFAWIINPTQPMKSEWLFPETPLISKLKSLQGDSRLLPVSRHDPSGQWTPPVFAGKVNVDFDLRSGSGYENVLPLPTATLWRTVENGGVVAKDLPPAYRPYFYHDRLPIRLLEKLSIGFIATPPKTEPRDIDGSNSIGDGSLELVYQGLDGWIYKLPRALPRAFVVPTILTVPDPETSLRTLSDGKFDARQAAILIGENAAAKAGLPMFNSPAPDTGGTATIVRDRLNEVEVEVNTPRAAMLVLNDSWDAGWVARVDGQKQPVLQVNYAFRGVVVPAGNHRVVFLYRPPLLLIGLGISGLTIFLLFLLCGAAAFSYLRRSSR